MKEALIIYGKPHPVKPWNGREVETRIVFKKKGTFENYYMAKNWLHENGYSDGSMARDLPIGLLKEENILIAKWGNLTKEEISELDGVMISDDFREGNVEIIIFKK